MERLKENHYPAPTLRSGALAFAPLWRPSLVALLALCLPVAALAQQGGASILQTSRTPRYATNLALPTRAEDTFLGQEKTGPYSLSWRNFQFGPGNPVLVYIDGRQLIGAEYTLDVPKGEITFANPVKRSQLVRIVYGYYLSLAQRNPNPTQTAPLTVSLAALGFGEFKMTALPGADGSPTPRLVWSLGGRQEVLGGGLTSSFFFAPEKVGAGGADGAAIDRSMVKLGYGAGDAKNGIEMAFLRGGRNFAPAVGKSFGVAEAVESSSVAGRLNPRADASLSFSRADSRNLNSPVASELQTTAFKLGGLKNRPALGFSRTEDTKTNAQGQTTAVVTDKGDLSGKFGAADLAFKNSRVATELPNHQSTRVDQSVYAFNLPAVKAGRPALGFTRTEDGKTEASGARTETTTDKADFASKFGRSDLGFKSSRVETQLPTGKSALVQLDTYSFNLPNAGKVNRPSLGFARTDDIKQDAAGARTAVTTDKLNLGGKFGRTDLGFASNRIDTQLPGDKNTLADVQTFSLNLPAAKAGRPALGFTRIEDTKVDAAGGRTETDTNKTDFAGKFGVADIQAKLNRAGTVLPDQRTATIDQQNIGVKIAAPKQPVLGFTRVGDVKTDAAGVRVGALTDTIGLTGALNGIQYQIQNIQSDTGTADRRRVFGDLNTYSLQTGGKKNQPLLGFFRSENDLKQATGEWGRLTTDRYDLTQRQGIAQLGFQFQRAAAVTSDQRVADGDLRTVGVQVAGAGLRPTVAVQRTEGDLVDLSAAKTGIVSDKVDLTGKLGPASVSAQTKQTFTTPVNVNAPSGVAREAAFSLNAPGGTKGTGAFVTVSTGNVQTGSALEQKQGLALKLQPAPGISLSTEQKDHTLMPTGIGGPTRNIVSQSTGAEIAPRPGTRLAGTWTTSNDGANKTAITDLNAKLGGDKSLLQLEGALKDRSATVGGAPANTDTANAKFAVRPFGGVTVTGSYLLNPEVPGKANTYTPLERREYGLNAKIGRFDLGGTYADNELLPGTPADVIQKAGGAPEYGEMGLTLGWRFGATSMLTSQYKDTFFNGGPTSKGLQTLSLGFTHNVGAAFSLSVNGSYSNNRAIADPNTRTMYKAEAKLGVKF